MKAAAGGLRSQRRRRGALRAALLAGPALFWSYVFAALAAGGDVTEAPAPGGARLACVLVGALAAVVVGMGAARGRDCRAGGVGDEHER